MIFEQAKVWQTLETLEEQKNELTFELRDQKIREIEEGVITELSCRYLNVNISALTHRATYIAPSHSSHIF